jgi:ElaB/YqjD/DUF883 family membrane-anchored ribosome-binding protein
MTPDNNNKLGSQPQPFPQPQPHSPPQPQPQPQDFKASGDKTSAAPPKQEAKPVVKAAPDKAPDKVEGKDVVIEKALEIKDIAVEKATQTKDAVVEKAGEIKDAAVETAHQAADTLSDTYDEVSYQTRRLGAATWRFTTANALPLGLIGLGSGLLIANQRRASARTRAPEPMHGDWDDEVGEYVGENTIYPAFGDSATDYGSSVRSEMSTPASGTERRNGRPSSESKRQPSAGKRARRAAEDVKDETVALTAKAGRAWDSARSKISDGARSSGVYAQAQLRRVRDGSRNLAQSNPLAFAIGTLVAGIGVGLILPATAREDALLAPSREKVRRAIGRARDTADDVGRVVKRTAQDTMATLEAQSH